MSVLIFPASPVDGELYPPEPIPGVNQYQWDAATSTWELLIPSGFVLTVSPNCGLELTGTDNEKNLNTIYNTLIPDEKVSVPVGGAEAQPASVWKEKNLVQVFDTILFPELFPTYVIPSISLSYTLFGYQEVGDSVVQSLEVTGVKNDAGPFTELSFFRNGAPFSSDLGPTANPYTPLPDQFDYPNENNPNYSYEFSDTDSFTVSAGVTEWRGSGSFNQGQPLKTDEGNEDPRPAQFLSANAPQLSGSLYTETVQINGIYPYFWGKSVSAPTAGSIAAAIAAGTENKVLLPSSGTISATFDADAEYIWFAHPSSYTTKTRWYNTPFNQSIIEPSGFIAPAITQTVNSPDGFWSSVSYKVYISNYATNTIGSMELRNS